MCLSYCWIMRNRLPSGMLIDGWFFGGDRRPVQRTVVAGHPLRNGKCSSTPKASNSSRCWHRRSWLKSESMQPETIQLINLLTLTHLKWKPWQHGSNNQFSPWLLDSAKAHNETTAKMATSQKPKNRTRLKVKVSMAKMAEIIDARIRNVATEGPSIHMIQTNIAIIMIHEVTAQTSAMQPSETDRISQAVQAKRSQTSNPRISKISISLAITLLIRCASLPIPLQRHRRSRIQRSTCLERRLSS